MQIDPERTALVITHPQNDFLSPEGVTWGVVGESVTENNTVEVCRCHPGERLAEVFAGAATFGTVDADRNPQITNRVGLASVPALVFLKGGAVVDLVVGITSRSELEARVKALL